jgi:uncharacterized membrane protein required for colicin V production
MSNEIITQISAELESQSLNAVVAGFSFAAALAWMDLVRWTIHQVVKVQKNSGTNYALTAIVTTLLSVLIYIIMSRLSKRVQKPNPTVYAVGR